MVKQPEGADLNQEGPRAAICGPLRTGGEPRGRAGKGCTLRHMQSPALGQPSCHPALPPGSGFSLLLGVRVKPPLYTPPHLPPRSPPRATRGPCVHPHPPTLAQPCFLGKLMGREHLSGATCVTSLPLACLLGPVPLPSGRVSKGNRSVARVPECHSAPWRPPLSRQWTDAESQPQGTCAVSLPLPRPALMGHGTLEGHTSGFPAPAFHISPWHLFTDA